MTTDEILKEIEKFTRMLKASELRLAMKPYNMVADEINADNQTKFEKLCKRLTSMETLLTNHVEHRLEKLEDQINQLTAGI